MATFAIEINDRIHFMSVKKENMVINLNKINREKVLQDINGKQAASNVSMKDGGSYPENATVVTGYFQTNLHLLLVLVLLSLSSQLLELIITTVMAAVIITLMEVTGALQGVQVKEV
jgi:hypothetical protein